MTVASNVIASTAVVVVVVVLVATWRRRWNMVVVVRNCGRRCGQVTGGHGTGHGLMVLCRREMPMTERVTVELGMLKMLVKVLGMDVRMVEVPRDDATVLHQGRYHALLVMYRIWQSDF